MILRGRKGGREGAIATVGVGVWVEHGLVGGGIDGWVDGWMEDN